MVSRHVTGLLSKDPDMDVFYPFKEIYRNYDRATWWKSRFRSRILTPLHDRANQADFRVMDEDWDVLIVLDACREDLFREVVDIKRFDTYETRYSAGSATNEWARKNFSGQALTDTVYVTGNPVVSREVRTAFHVFVEVWRESFDEDIGTVPPESVTDAALETAADHPDQRLIVHYLQPHYPFIGYPNLHYATFGQTDEVAVADVREGANDVWEALELGLVEYDTVWEAYADNLRRVMDSVEDLLAEINGTIVITSDHGNLLGEPVTSLQIPMYGHPPCIYHPALREVPWAVIKGTRNVSDRQPEADIEDQLESLGYL